MGITFGASFLGGLVSFLSPCILPLVPGFIAYLGGSSLSDSTSRRKEIFLNSVCFVAGFSIVFALLGVLLNTVFERIAYDLQVWLARIGGALIIFFGLYLVGIIKLAFFEKEHKFHVKSSGSSRYLTSLLFGFAFAVGWTPCVGAILGGILTLAISQPGSAFALLLTYAAGLGIPFLLVGLFTAQAAEAIKKYAQKLKYVKIIFGVMLIVLGVLVFTENLNKIANLEFLSRFFIE